MKTLNIIVVLIMLQFTSSNTFAATTEDCSKYDTKTLMGTYDKARCEKGKSPRKKWNLGKKLKKLNPLNKN